MNLVKLTLIGIFPLSRKNPNGLAIIFGTEDYQDLRYPKLKYAARDRDVMRKYFNQAFGLSDFQLLPSKPWQMEEVQQKKNIE